jgi:AraC-like DNA-binding protein
MPDLTVGAGFASGLLRLAVAKGADPETLLRQAGIPEAALQDQDSRLPYTAYKALMRAGQILTNDPALALHYGETMDLAEFSIVGLISQAAETMGDALAQLNRFGRLVVEFEGPPDRFQHRLLNNEFWLIDTRQNPNDFPELTESTFARMVAGPRRFVPDLKIHAVHVTHAKPAHHAEYDRIFQAPITYNADKNALQIDPTLPAYRLNLAPRYVFGILSDHAQTLLNSLQSAGTTTARVEALLLPILHTGDANIDKIASAMAMSRQTLFRKLRAENTSFEKLLDALRHKLALHYLAGQKVSVNETAYLTGFSEPAAFSRAFKRWTGATPRSVRAGPPS